MKISSSTGKQSQDRYICILLVLVLVGSAFQNVKVIGPLNPGHLFALCFIPFLLPKFREAKFPPAVICIFLAYILCVSLFAGFQWGLNTFIINYLFVFYIIFFIVNLGRNISFESYKKVFQVAGILSFAIVILNAIRYKNAILAYFSSGYYINHPYYPTIFGGGANLEASWPSIYGVFFMDSPYGIIYLVLSFIFASIQVSRAGIIISLICLAIYAYKRLRESKNPFLILFLIFVTLSFGSFYALKLGIFQPILDRFFRNQEDRGAAGRVGIYDSALPFLCNHPFGVGLGNAVSAVNRVAANTVGMEPIVDDNLHNLFLQMTVETGVLGGVFYACLVAFLCFNCIFKHKFANPFENFLLAFFALSLIQFEKIEIFPAICLGILLSKKYYSYKDFDL